MEKGDVFKINDDDDEADQLSGMPKPWGQKGQVPPCLIGKRQGEQCLSFAILFHFFYSIPLPFC